MSYSNSFPQQRPTLNLDFANSGKLDSRISFSRADTPPTYAAPSAVHYWSNEKHLSSENLITNSEDFSAWTANNTTPTVNAVAAPDGNTTADTVTGNSGTSSKYVSSNSISAAPYPVISVYVKAGTHNYVQIHNDQSSTHYANFDVTSGAGVVGSVGSNTTSTIQAVGSTGWYRCICRINTASMTSGIKVRLVDSASAAYAASSATTGTVHLWGAMATDIGDLTNIAAYQSSGSQIHREYSSTLKSVANAGDPRFEYSPADGQSDAGSPLGLLVEAQSSNLLTYSEDFSNAAYTKFYANVESNVAISPTGELTTDKLTETTDPGEHRIGQNYSLTSGSSYTISVIAKAAGRNFIRLGAGNLGALPARVSFDLSNGTIGTVSYGTGKIESLGNGFYRCSVTATATSTATTSFEINVMQLTNTPSYTGDGYSGVLLFGAMAEQSSSMSSYIKSTSSSITRASDSCSVATSSFGYTGGDASFFADVSNAARTNAVAVTVRKNGSNELVLYGNSTGGNAYYVIADGAYSSKSFATSASGKRAFRMSTDDLAGSLNGAAVVTDTSQSLPDLTGATMHIGDDYNGGNSINGHIKRLALYNVALSDTELQAITS